VKHDFPNVGLNPVTFQVRAFNIRQSARTKCNIFSLSFVLFYCILSFPLYIFLPLTPLSYLPSYLLSRRFRNPAKRLLKQIPPPICPSVHKLETNLTMVVKGLLIYSTKKVEPLTCHLGRTILMTTLHKTVNTCSYISKYVILHANV
jgi:hypothetical protein